MRRRGAAHRTGRRGGEVPRGPPYTRRSCSSARPGGARPPGLVRPAPSGAATLGAAPSPGAHDRPVTSVRRSPAGRSGAQCGTVNRTVRLARGGGRRPTVRGRRDRTFEPPGGVPGLAEPGRRVSGAGRGGPSRTGPGRAPPGPRRGDGRSGRPSLRSGREPGPPVPPHWLARRRGPPAGAGRAAGAVSSPSATPHPGRRFGRRTHTGPPSLRAYAVSVSAHPPRRHHRCALRGGGGAGRPSSRSPQSSRRTRTASSTRLP